MIHRIFSKLKQIIKHLLGNCVYAYVYIKNSLQNLSKKSNKKHLKHKNNIFNIISQMSEKWKLFTAIFTLFFFVYYGIGATVSSTINNSLDAELKTTKDTPTFTSSALIHTLKSQIDDSPWTPALPIIFPASILDNLPNFQLGSKEGLNYIIKKLANHTNNSYLKEAHELLNYPSDIWLFSQTEQNKLSPGSAKQYRKATSEIIKFSISQSNLSSTPKDFIFMIKNINYVLNKQLTKLDKQIQEHNSEIFDINSDNIFYNAQGNMYSMYYILLGLSKDYQNFIVETNQYENITTALMHLSKSVNYSPLIIKNGAPDSMYSSNHLLYLAYHISQAQYYLTQIHYNTDNAIRKNAQ